MPNEYSDWQKEKAFDAYCAQVGVRSLDKLKLSLNDTEEFRDRTPSIATLKNWSVKNKWQDLASERDKKNARKSQAKTDTVIVNTKADYRKDVKLALQPVKAAINKAIVKNPDTGQMEVRIPIAEAKDLSSVISSFVNLIKMDLLLMGEADSRTDHRYLIDILKEAREENDGEDGS